MVAQLLLPAVVLVLWWALGPLTERTTGPGRLLIQVLRGGVLGVLVGLMLALGVTQLSASRGAVHYYLAMAVGLSLIGLAVGALAALAVWKRNQQPAEQAEAFATRLREASRSAQGRDEG